MFSLATLSISPLASSSGIPATLSTLGLPMLAVTWYEIIMMLGFIFFSFLLIMIILIQKPKGGGLSGAFGGGGDSAGAAFGAKTGDLLTWITVGFFVSFLLLAVGLNYATRPETAIIAPDTALPTDQTIETTKNTPENTTDPQPEISVESPAGPPILVTSETSPSPTAATPPSSPTPPVTETPAP